MKMKSYARAAALAALSFTSAGSLRAATVVDASAGADFGLVDTGVIYNLLTVPVNSAFGQTWLTPNLGLANMGVPVAQFTGFKDDGTPVPAGDLIPLKTTKVSVVNNAGAEYLTIDGSGSITGPGAAALANPYPRQFIQLQGSGIQYPVYVSGDPVSSRIYFGQQMNAFSPGSGSVFPNFTAGTITLKAGRSYKLTFNAVRFSTWYTVATTPILFFQFKNVTTGQFFGPPGVCENNQPVATNYGILTAFITPTVDTVVALEVQGAYNGPTLTNPELVVETAD